MSDVTQEPRNFPRYVRHTIGAPALFAAMLLLAPLPAAAFTLDGILTTTGPSPDAYTDVFDLSFELEGKKDTDPNKTVNGGNIRAGRDGPNGDVFILIEVPIDVVDNVFGNATATAGSGWTTTDKNGDPKPQGHSLSDLLNSDKLEFDLTIGNSVTAISVDYDGQTSPGSGGVKGYSTSLVFNLDEIDKGTAGFGDTTNSPDPIAGPAPSVDWVQAVQYEIQLDASLFGAGESVSANDLSAFILHASPNKGKFDNKVRVSCVSDCTPTTTTTVPEPGALALLGVGLIGLAWFRRRHS